MKRIIMGLLSGILFLSACGQTPSATQTAPVPVVEQATATPSSFPTSTQTSLPTATPTASITPLPTIPTFTPTFDISTIVTVTPAPKAECTVSMSDNTILEMDLTNDELPELVVKDSDSRLTYRILKCDENEYKTLFSINDEKLYFMGYKFIDDANKNGIPEILFSKSRCDFSGCLGKIKVIEWDGNIFSTILEEPNLGTFYNDIEIRDWDRDGINEISWSGGIPVEDSWNWFVVGPWRLETHIYKWNSTTFASESIKYAIPDFRFQALQDGDRYVLENRYTEALSLYQDVIFSDKLDWWSPDRYSQQHDAALTLGTNLDIPTLVAPNITEYPRLAAYAYYRIMLLHLVQNHESDATTTYNTLQQKFSNNPYAHPYVEMASAFWDSYQSTHKMYDGCATAIQYTVEHPEILIPLGSDYHGAQSHTYVPADVCPFR